MKSETLIWKISDLLIVKSTKFIERPSVTLTFRDHHKGTMSYYSEDKQYKNRVNNLLRDSLLIGDPLLPVVDLRLSIKKLLYQNMAKNNWLMVY